MQITGRVSVHPRGFGFVNFTSPTSSRSLSAFVVPPDLKPFLTDDTVEAEVETAADGRLNARNLRLISRLRRTVFGEVVERRGRPFVRVDREVSNTDWPLDGPAAARPGDYIVARVGERGLVLERLLEADADLALERLVARYGLQVEHSAAALEEAARVPESPSAEGHRRDLRALPTITVDAASTRDIDDAVSALPAASDGALRLLVSIADPAEYVLPGTALDDEARARGTTVYLAGRTLPMLPDVLSADRLSLWPDVDRCALTVELRIDAEGRVTATDVNESVVRSHARLTYDEVDAYLENGTVSAAMRPAESIMPWLRTASSRLAIARGARGGMRMPREEAYLSFEAESGQVVGAERRRSTAAHLMIERFMVAANEAVAEWLEARGVPALYRVHAEPDAARVAELGECARRFGYEAGFPAQLSPRALAAFEDQIEGTPAEPAMRSVMLRALGPARYTVNGAPHFGLAAPRYLHFTSPLRRYADLEVHRTIKQYLRGRRGHVPLDPAVEALAAHLNERTVSAGRAENDRHRQLIATWMAKHIGEVFAAHLTRIRPFGVVAQIDASLVEGVIPFDALPGTGWRADEGELSVSSSSGATFAIGDAVRVSVRSTDPTQGRIEYELVREGGG